MNLGVRSSNLFGRANELNGLSRFVLRPTGSSLTEFKEKLCVACAAAGPWHPAVSENAMAQVGCP